MDPKVLARIRGLLAKAESTEFPAEADSCTAKALEMMTTHGVEQAHIDAVSGRRPSATSIRIDFDNPYSLEKATLLGCVAEPLGCQIAIFGTHRTSDYATVVGMPTDLELVEMLYTSLLLQGTTQVVRQRPWDVMESIAAYRRTWWLGFAYVIEKRLKAAYAKAATEHVSDGPSTALVLRDRAALVADTFAGMFPELGKPHKRNLTGSGGGAGAIAGRNADIGTDRRVERTRQAAIR